MDKDLDEVCRSVLMEQNIHYPPKFGIKPFKQTNGQLMGSTLSFPVLCIANLICYVAAFNRFWASIGSGRRMRLDDICALINGDDSLFPCNARIYAFWKEACAEMGFQLSPGKCLVHRSIATVNSMQWYYNWATKTWTFDPYFNTGLLLRAGSGKIARLSTGLGDSVAYDLASVWNEMKPGCADEIQAFADYLRLHKEKINKMTHSGLYNLFLPIQIGGLGFHRPEQNKKQKQKTLENTKQKNKKGEEVCGEFEVRLTHFQRVLAHKLLENVDSKVKVIGFVPQDRFRNVQLREDFPLARLCRIKNGRLINPPDPVFYELEEEDLERDPEVVANTCKERFEKEEFVNKFRLQSCQKSIVRSVRLFLKKNRKDGKVLFSGMASSEDLFSTDFKFVKYRLRSTLEAMVHAFDANLTNEFYSKIFCQETLSATELHVEKNDEE